MQLLTLTAAQGVVWLGFILILAGIYILMRAQASPTNPIDLAHVLIDSKTGRTSIKAVGELVALLTSTWIVVYLAVDKTLTEWIFTAYLASWVSRALLGGLAQAKADAITKGTAQ